MNTFILKEIIEDIFKEGGIVYYVGGFVRDEFLNKKSKDIDLEIHNIEPIKLKAILSKFGEVEEVGASFGILMIKGLDIDFSMPRRERNTGNTHTSFEVEVNPFLGTYEASRRRDFTFNALMQNCKTGEITDHFGGINDINNKLIRHIDDEKFIEDPLRVLRACQFSSRFSFQISDETKYLCSKIDITSLPKKRIFDEFEKACTKGNLGVFLRELKSINQCHYHFGIIDEDSLIRISEISSKNKLTVEEGIALIHFFNKEEDILEKFVEKKSILKNVRNVITLLRNLIDKKIKLEEVILDCIDIDFFIKIANLLEINIEEDIRNLQLKLKRFSITGNDLINAGMKPNKNFSKLLREAYILQLQDYSKEDIIKLIKEKELI